MKVREICVFGGGVNAINFTHLWREKIKIVAYIDNYKTQDFFAGMEQSAPILGVEEAESLLKKYFVAVATSENIFWEVKKQLDGMGLVEFSDYCFYGIYEKKIAIIYGNCHVLPVKEGLSISHAFSEQYGFYPIRQIQNISQFNGEDLESKVFERCDLFIHQSVQEDNRYGKEYSSTAIINKLNKKCIVLAIPNLYGLPKMFFPQIDMSLQAKCIGDRKYFPYRDKYIERMYQEGNNCEYIVNVIKSDAVTSEKAILDEYDKFVDRLKLRERDWDIKISEWLLENIKNEQLFYDIHHPTNFVIKYIIKGILKLLHIDEEPELDYLPKLDAHEVPLYGQVFKLFDMQWNNRYILRKYSKYTLTNQQINLEEYVLHYIKWNCFFAK